MPVPRVSLCLKHQCGIFMKRKIIINIFTLVAGALVAGLVLLIHGDVFAVLDPKGVIAAQQRDLIIVVTLLMMLVVIPVFGMTFFIAWKYRAGNTKARYQPDWDHNRWAEITWWGFPLLIITILSVIIWRSSHELDPSQAIASPVRPLTVEVVALQWKWLFIYPEQGVASVNYLQFPERRPIDFKITADAPMNSFWIPQLGGQIYAMPGMETQLHLMADHGGRYEGSSANLSGKGFADMRFIAESVKDDGFSKWVASAKAAGVPTLDNREYTALALPATTVKTSMYSAVDDGLYDRIIMKYMHSTDESGDTQTNQHAGHTAY